MNNITLLPTRRSAWLLLLLSTIMLQIAALYFQYALDLAPCVKCINQRSALYGVMLAAFVGYFFTPVTVLRIAAVMGWLYFSYLGLLQAYSHVDNQLNPHPFFNSCEITPFFPDWLPLHEWLPLLFAAPGDCGSIDWQFLGLSMPQWMLGFFVVYFSGAIITALITLYNVVTRR